jgi:hypothetical protein
MRAEGRGRVAATAHAGYGRVGRAAR